MKERALLQRELARFNPDIPIARASTPPASWYLLPEFLSAETQAVFKRAWHPVARLGQLANEGAFVSGEILGLPYVVLRQRSGELAAYYNTCRHHAARIVNGSGSGLKDLSCPYHGWTYGLDGALKAAPRTEGIEDFKLECFSLVPLAVETWGPWVWIHFGGKDSAPLGPTLSELHARLAETGFEKLHFHSRRSYEIECNWKVYVDNYLDGGYHVPVLHRALTAQLDLASYRTETFDRYSIQSCGGRSKERIGHGALYAWLYPGFMINRYGPAMDTNWVIPLTPTRTLTVFDFYFEDVSSTQAEAFISESLVASERVQAEDVTISESVQKGLGSGAYQVGRYAPRLEQGEHHFHKLLAGDLGAFEPLHG